MAAFIVTPYVTNYEWLALSKVSALHVRIHLDVCTCTFYNSNSTPACVYIGVQSCIVCFILESRQVCKRFLDLVRNVTHTLKKK